MFSSLTVILRSEAGEEEYSLILPSLSDLKIIQCLQAVFQLVLKSPPKLKCQNVQDLLSKTFHIDQVSWEPPDSFLQDQEDGAIKEKKKVSLSDLGDIPLSRFQEVMKRFESGVETVEDIHSDSDSGQIQTPEIEEGKDTLNLSSSKPKIRKVDLGDYELPKLGEKTCSVCQKSFKSWTILSKHFVRHNSSSEKLFYFCKVCNQWATNRIEIETHKHLARTSLDRQRGSFKCDQCNKEFKRRHQLETHWLVHSGLKQFGCEKCGKLFKQIGHLQAHVEEIHETNLEKRDFICNLCGRGYPSSRKLKYHLNYTHSDKKLRKYDCPTCGKAFSRAKLRPHQMREHENNLPHSCKYCDKRFVSKYYVTRHLRQTHKVENIEI